MLPANEERENTTVVNYTEAYIVAEVRIFDLVMALYSATYSHASAFIHIAKWII